MRKVLTFGIVLTLVLLSASAAKVEDKKNDCGDKNDSKCSNNLNKKSQNDEPDKKNRSNIDLKELSDEPLDDEVGTYGMDDVPESNSKRTSENLPPCFMNKPPMEFDEDPDVIEDQVDDIDYSEREIGSGDKESLKVEEELGIPPPEQNLENFQEASQGFGPFGVENFNGMQMQGANFPQFQMPPFNPFGPFNQPSQQPMESFAQDHRVREAMEQQRIMEQMDRQRQLQKLRIMQQQRKQLEAQQEMSRIFEAQRQQKLGALGVKNQEDIFRPQMDRQRGDNYQQPSNFGLMQAQNFGGFDRFRNPETPFSNSPRSQLRQEPRYQYQQGDGFRRSSAAPRRVRRSNKFQEIEEALFRKKEELMLERQRLIDEQRSRAEQVDARRQIWRRS